MRKSNALVPTLLRGNPDQSLAEIGMHSHAGAWERGKLDAERGEALRVLKGLLG